MYSSPRFRRISLHVCIIYPSYTVKYHWRRESLSVLFPLCVGVSDSYWVVPVQHLKRVSEQHYSTTYSSPFLDGVFVSPGRCVSVTFTWGSTGHGRAGVEKETGAPYSPVPPLCSHPLGSITTLMDPIAEVRIVNCCVVSRCRYRGVLFRLLLPSHCSNLMSRNQGSVSSSVVTEPLTPRFVRNCLMYWTFFSREEPLTKRER